MSADVAITLIVLSIIVCVPLPDFTLSARFIHILMIVLFLAHSHSALLSHMLLSLLFIHVSRVAAELWACPRRFKCNSGPMHRDMWLVRLQGSAAERQAHSSTGIGNKVAKRQAHSSIGTTWKRDRRIVAQG